MNLAFPLATPLRAGLLLSVSISLAHAQNLPITPDTEPAPVTTLPVVTAVASRSPQPLPDVLGDVTVIDRAALDAAAGQSVGDVLRRVAGIEVTTNGGPQTVTRLFLRGSNSNQTLVLIDGMRINAANSGGAAFNALALDDLERIEVLRGAASSLYGADAIGGVINLVTREAADGAINLFTELGVGSRGTLKGQVRLSGSPENWRYSVQAGYAQSDGFDATEPGFFLHNPDRDSWYQRHVSARLGHTWAAGQDLDLTMIDSQINGGYDAGLPAFNDRSVQGLQSWQLRSRNEITARWTSILRLGWQRDTLDNHNAPASLNPDNPPDGITRFSSRQRQLTWQNEIALHPDHDLTLGAEWLEQRVGGDLADYGNWPEPPQYVNYAETRRMTRAAFAIWRGSWRNHHLQMSLRHDNDSQYGDQNTGGVAWAWDATDRLRLGVAASTAFRAPDFNELYYPGGGNPDLRPEHARNVEASVSYTLDQGDLSLTWYRNRVRDLIAGFPSENIHRAVLEGITFEWTQQWGDTTLAAVLDWQDPRDADTGEILPLRAQQIARLHLAHDLGRWQPAIDWYATSSRTDPSANQTLGGYALLDLALGYRVSQHTDLQLRWNNVFDRQHQVVWGYATPGSEVFLTLRHQL